MPSLGNFFSHYFGKFVNHISIFFFFHYSSLAQYWLHFNSILCNNNKKKKGQRHRPSEMQKKNVHTHKLNNRKRLIFHIFPIYSKNDTCCDFNQPKYHFHYSSHLYAINVYQYSKLYRYVYIYIMYTVYIIYRWKPNHCQPLLHLLISILKCKILKTKFWLRK